jgi:NAD(P)-dependent dehydrogenase (short-subunit alcohol dehydrogenase family)
VEGAIACAVKEFGRLDCLFNNAGFGGVMGAIADIPADGFDSTMRVLVRGVFLGIKHAARAMKAQGSGSIVSTASIAGLGTGFGPHIYSAAKAAVIHLTKSVAMELGESNIRVNCICPGGIATPIFGQAFNLGPEHGDKVVGVMKQVLEKIQPIPRAGMPLDIAHAAMWLASDDSTFVNGHALVVDGGVSLGRKWSEGELRRKALAQVFGVSG